MMLHDTLFSLWGRRYTKLLCFLLLRLFVPHLFHLRYVLKTWLVTGFFNRRHHAFSKRLSIFIHGGWGDRSDNRSNDRWRLWYDNLLLLDPNSLVILVDHSIDLSIPLRVILNYLTRFTCHHKQLRFINFNKRHWASVGSSFDWCLRNGIPFSLMFLFACFHWRI